MLLLHRAHSPAAAGARDPAMPKASRQPDLLVTDVSLQVTTAQSVWCLAGWAHVQFFCRRCAVAEDMLPGGGEEDMNKLCIFEWMSKRLTSYLEMLHSQDSEESQTAMVVEKLMDLESCKVISQGSVGDEGWKQVSALKVLPLENN